MIKNKALRIATAAFISVMLTLALFSALIFAGNSAFDINTGILQTGSLSLPKADLPLPPDADDTKNENNVNGSDATQDEVGDDGLDNKNDTPDDPSSPTPKPDDTTDADKTPGEPSAPDQNPDDIPGVSETPDEPSAPDSEQPKDDDTLVCPAPPENGGDDAEKDFRSEFVEIVKGELGIKEAKYNNVKYNTWYYGRVVRATSSNSSSYAWCVTFVSWCANAADIDTSVIPKMCNAEAFRKFFEKNGQYTARKSATPKAGDIVFFGSKSSNHVGVVVGVDGKNVTVIEGNYSDKVSMNTYSLGESTILGYASPDF